MTDSFSDVNNLKDFEDLMSKKFEERHNKIIQIDNLGEGNIDKLTEFKNNKDYKSYFQILLFHYDRLNLESIFNLSIKEFQENFEISVGKNYRQNLALASTVEMKDGLYDGKFISYSGQKEFPYYIDEYKNGTLDGISKRYSELNNGAKVLVDEMPYKDGKLHGISLSYNLDSQVILQKEYVEGILISTKNAKQLEDDILKKRIDDMEALLKNMDTKIHMIYKQFYSGGSQI